MGTTLNMAVLIATNAGGEFSEDFARRSADPLAARPRDTARIYASCTVICSVLYARTVFDLI